MTARERSVQGAFCGMRRSEDERELKARRFIFRELKISGIE